MARKSNLFKLNNNTVINIVVLVIVLVLLYLFLGKYQENFTVTTVDYIKSSYFTPQGSTISNSYLLVMYYAPWCYYSKVALTGEDGYGGPSGKTSYDEIQIALGFDGDREKLGVEHTVNKDNTTHNITMAAINCDESGSVNDVICSGAGITAYPTIKLYKKDAGTNVVTDEGEYTEEIKMGTDDGNEADTINKFLITNIP